MVQPPNIVSEICSAYNDLPFRTDRKCIYIEQRI